MTAVAFYKGRTRLFNRLVSWWLSGPYSHCELVLDTDSAGYSRCISSSFIDGGVRIKWIKLDPTRWDVVPIANVPGAMDWFEHHDSAGYDLLGLLGFVWRPHRDDKAKWFCSEAVAAMLGYPEPWRFDPCALAAALHQQKVPPIPIAGTA